MERYVVLLALLCSGCMKHVQVRPGEVVIPNECLISLKATDQTFCHGPDGSHVRCEHVEITRKVGCEKIVLNPKTKGNK